MHTDRRVFLSFFLLSVCLIKRCTLLCLSQASLGFRVPSLVLPTFWLLGCANFFSFFFHFSNIFYKPHLMLLTGIRTYEVVFGISNKAVLFNFWFPKRLTFQVLKIHLNADGYFLENISAPSF